MNEELRENQNQETTEENNSRKGLGAVLIGGALAIGGLAVVGVRALAKRKKSNQPEDADQEPETESTDDMVEDDEE